MAARESPAWWRSDASATSAVSLSLRGLRPTLDAALVEMRGDGPAVNAEVVGEIGERAAGLVAGDEFVDVGVRQSALDRRSARV